MGIFKRFLDKVSGQKSAIDSDWEELTQELLSSDLGRELSLQIVKSARNSRLEPFEAVKSELTNILSSKDRSTKSGVILVVGVNGTGKTKIGRATRLNSSH